MWTRRVPLLSLFVFTLAATFVCAQAQDQPKTSVWLVSDQSAVRPGSQIWVGIRFQLEPGWHLYWLNPGDSGEPPRVQWVLPAGWTSGPIEWPAPERITNPAGVDYGYNNEAALLTRVNVPATAKLGVADLNANLRWLVCKEMCVAQKSPVSLSLTVSHKAIPDSAGKQQIEAIRARLPKALPAAWKANVVTNPRQFLVNFVPGTKIESAVFFPEEQQVIQNASPQNLAATSVRAQLALDKGDAAASTKALKGVLVLNGSDAYALDLPIKR
jgi:DsbC/DsbD-like thiol-disulfide interchange protein